jgi:hypothetical protein
MTVDIATCSMLLHSSFSTSDNSHMEEQDGDFSFTSVETQNLPAMNEGFCLYKLEVNRQLPS